MTAIYLTLRSKNAMAISLKSDETSLGISESDWRNSLKRAELDEAVGIRHKEILGEAAYRLHVAAIPIQVGCHYHAKGDENYAVVEGEGILFFGKVTNGQVLPEDWRSIAVSTGNSFVIPEGYAHQLRKVGTGDLTILFGCPDSHLNDEQDRHLLPHAPSNVGGLSAG